MANSEYDLILWANVIAGTSVVGYAFFVWAQVRGAIQPSERMIFAVRLTCLVALLLPIGARFQFSQFAILTISVLIVAFGAFIRWRNKIGL